MSYSGNIGFAISYISSNNDTSGNQLSGSYLGTNIITIHGSNVYYITSALFGTVPATVISRSESEVKFQVPRYSGTFINGAHPTTITFKDANDYIIATAPFDYYVDLIINSSTYNYSAQAGGEVILINGSGFKDPFGVNTLTHVYFGKLDTSYNSGQGFTIIDSSNLSIRSPYYPQKIDVSAVINLTVQHDGVTSLTSSNSLFTYYPKSIINHISNVNLPAYKNNTIVIDGSNLLYVTDVSFGPYKGTVVPPNTDNKVTVISPILERPDISGVYDVHLISHGGVSDVTLPDVVTFYPKPIVYKITPNQVTYLGGTTITIDGSGLTYVTDVSFGPLYSSSGSNITIINDSQIRVITPAIPRPDISSVFDVHLISYGGVSDVSSSDLITFYPKPIINSITPNKVTSLGGTTITIDGDGLTYVFDVSFGSLYDSSGAKITIINDNRIQVVTPAVARPDISAVMDVHLYSPDNVSDTTSSDIITFYPKPIIDKITYNNIPATGTKIIIDGDGLTYVYDVSYGPLYNSKGQDIDVISDNRLIVNTPVIPQPDVSAVYDVRLLSPDNVSDISSSDVITFYPTPFITHIDLSFGATSGFETMIIDGSGFSTTSSVVFHSVNGDLSANSFTIISDTRLRVTTPVFINDISSVCDIIIGTYGGHSAANPSTDRFTFCPRPVINYIDPPYTTEDGNTYVTIHGTGLSFAHDICFNTVGLGHISFTIIDDNRLLVLTPHYTHDIAYPTNAWVSVYTVGGVSYTISEEENNYVTYYPKPKINGVVQNFGSMLGGGFITIFGNYLADASYVVINNTEIPINSSGTFVDTSSNENYLLRSNSNVMVTTPNIDSIYAT